MTTHNSQPQRVIVALRHFRMSGVNTWAYLLVKELRSLGHSVSVWFRDVETMDTRIVGWFAALGDDVQVTIVDPPPGEYDLAICNYNDLVYQCNKVAKRTVFVKHGTMFDLYDETKANGVIDTVVCLSLQSTKVTTHHDIRLVENFVEPLFEDTSPVTSVKTALLCDIRTGHNYFDHLRKAFADALDIDVHTVSDVGNKYVLNIHKQFHRYDIIIGYGRVIREALVSGRHALVYGINGGDGFVDLDNFAKLYQRNFSGWATRILPPPSGDSYELRDYLSSYKFNHAIPAKLQKECTYILANITKSVQNILRGKHE